MLTFIIIGITALVSIQAFSNGQLFSKFVFAPNYISRTKEWHRFFTYGLLHGDWMHLLFNMFAFYSFGQAVESAYKNLYPGSGSFLYLFLYISALPISSLVDYFQHKNNPNYMAVGASGAVSAVIFSSVLIYPTGGILIFPIPFSIPAYIFGPLFLGFSAYMSKDPNSRIGHAAHFYGAVYGLVFTIITIPGIVTHFIQEVFG
ncbi:MAG: rhomboid family intramembrane serine protease [Chitinophagales bacterium]|nr:rhomboid family intramembrane serine protease [Chitinophagales bacterium]